MNPILDEFGYFINESLVKVFNQARSAGFTVMMDFEKVKKEKEDLMATVNSKDTFERKIL